jgi:hypothetical protein
LRKGGHTDYREYKFEKMKMNHNDEDDEAGVTELVFQDPLASASLSTGLRI